MDARDAARDFFISYRTADQPWAEWIAWELEAAGYSVFLQAWDFRPGQNFVHQMQQGAFSCRRTIAVLTPAYFESGFARAEWYSAFARDPTGEAGLLLPVRAAECDVVGLLGPIIYIDLVGLEKAQARERLLAGIEGTRAKPPQPPPFPDIFPDNRDIRVIPPLPPPTAEDRRGLLILLDRVTRFWVEGVLDQSVQHEALINLGKETRPGAVEHPWEQVVELPNAASQRLAPDTRVADVFEQVGRLLLILGEPGSGKTTTLLELARDLVARARNDPGQPVPVLFNLSSWNEKFKALSDWVTEELKTKYVIPKRIGRSWLDGNRLLLLLDGLDEVQAYRRAACIRAINAFLEDQGTPGLAVCSRLAEYTAEPVRLKMSGAICLRPLTATQIEAYLSSLGSQLDALRAALSKDDLLRDLAKSPLMLSVMTLAYQGRSVGPSAGEAIETPEARRKEIFDTYVDRMFARKGKAARSAHAKDQSKSWLSWLAQNMQRHGQTIFLIEQLQPTWLNNIHQIAIYILLSRLVLGITMLAAFFMTVIIVLLSKVFLEFPRPEPTKSLAHLIPALLLLGTLYSSSIDMFRYKLKLANPQLSRISRQFVLDNTLIVLLLHTFGWIAIITVLAGAVGSAFGLTYCRRNVAHDIRIADRFTWSWSRPLVCTAVLAVLLFLGVLLKGTPQSVLVMFGNALGISTILCWPFLVFFMGVRVAVLEVGEMTNYGIRSTLANASRAGLGMYACAVPLVLLVTYVLWLRNVPLFQLIDFGWFWTIAALAVAFAYGGVDVINHYVLRLIVYRNGYVPKGLHGFLDHCTKLVFLRRVGGGYIFIHRLLLEHFAAMWEVQAKGLQSPFRGGFCPSRAELTRAPRRSRPRRLGRQGHQDRVGIAAGFDAEAGAPVP